MAARSLFIRNGLLKLRESMAHGRSSIKFSQFERYFHLTQRIDKRVSFNLSDIGEGIRDVVIKEWFVKVGDSVEQFDDLCEVQSDKASVTITSRYDGKIVHLHKAVDEVALVGKPLLDFEIEDDMDSDKSSSSDTSSSSSSSSSSEESKNETEVHQENNKRKVLATPAVRRIAMEHKINLTEVPATGKLGRVLKGDVLEYLNIVPQGTNKPHPTLVPQPQPASVSIPLASVSKVPASIAMPSAVDRVEVLKGVRKAMLKSMTESQKIPHFGYNDEIDVTKLVDLRKELKKTAESRGIKLTFMPFFIKAASLALAKYPILNSSLDLASESIQYKTLHNISVAIASPEGLVVPNIKNCQNKNLLKIAQDLSDLQTRAQDGKLKPDDFTGGTFSLSNIGSVGGTYCHACIMPPQVSIGAIGKIRILPRFDAHGNVYKAHIMNISWTADHRVIDGVTMASFSELWKMHLENPNLFILN